MSILFVIDVLLNFLIVICLISDHLIGILDTNFLQPCRWLQSTNSLLHCLQSSNLIVLQIRQAGAELYQAQRWAKLTSAKLWDQLGSEHSSAKS